MAYTNFINCTKQQYTNIIYSQEDINRIRIWFNNVEFIDAGEYCVSLTGTNRILPTDGSKRFTLSNFIAKEYDLVLRDVPQEVIIQDQVKISIGTVVDIEYVATSDETYQVSKEYYTYSNNTYTLLVAGTDYQIGAEITGTVYETSDIYEDVPIGIFNIQDTPTTNNNQITIKLRDNRVKFDFNYNAQPLIEQSGGSATLGAILNDMCTKAGVTNDVSSFAGDNIAVAIYDNTIKATNYVGYIAEQAGAIPIITREGHLDFVYLDNLQTWQIPLDIVEKYELGTPYQIKRVVYESGTIKYETSSDITLDTLYLDSSNMYITTQAQVNTVFNIVEDFELDSALTGKVLGNPAIDPYDIIEIYGYYTEDEDGNATFVADTNTIVLRTLANNTYNYSGVSTNTFETQIGKEERKENVLKSGDESFKAWARSEIDNLNVEIIQTVGKIDTIESTVYGEYELTEDTTFQEEKTYYIKSGDNYIEFTDYEEGETIPPNTIYELNETSSLEQRVQQAELTITEQGATLETKTQKIDENGNTTSFKTTNYTLDGNGFLIDDGSGYKSLSDTTGQYYYDNDTIIAKYTKDGSVQKDLALLGNYYYGIDESVQIDRNPFNKDNAMFMAQLYEDNNGDIGFGHFYNGS